jgi:5-methylcytosine-specific restriction endonuclease McrA
MTPSIETGRGSKIMGYAIIGRNRVGMLDSVLVLNANFEPIHICNTRRALSLIINQKAALILNGRGYIHTVTTLYPIPSIIRLEKMIVRPRPIVQLTRHEVFRRDGYTCQYCGTKGGDLTIDHVIPRLLDGPHSWTNVVTACIKCNHFKGAKTPEQAGMHLLKIPALPPSSTAYYFQKHMHENDNWIPFIEGW